MTEETQSVCCPKCGGIITSKSFKNPPEKGFDKCEHCGEDLHLEITRKGDTVYLNIPDWLSGHYLPIVKINQAI